MIFTQRIFRWIKAITFFVLVVAHQAVGSEKKIISLVLFGLIAIMHVRELYKGEK